ncbi:MAG: DNA polymerase III subunit epsilon, partial [Allorhizobium sp.]
AALGLTSVETRRNQTDEVTDVIEISYERPRALAPRLSPTEVEGHGGLVARLGAKAIWSKYSA